MHWREAIDHSPQEMAVRIMTNGRRMMRFLDGEGQIELSLGPGFRRVEQESLEGFMDWEPAQKEAHNMNDDIPRRCRVNLLTPAELSIRQAIVAVELVGAHPLLTDAVNLLSQAKDKVADYIDRPPAPQEAQDE